MMEHEHTEHIAAKPESVYAAISDPANVPRFVPQVTAVREAGDERVEVDARYEGRRGLHPRGHPDAGRVRGLSGPGSGEGLCARRDLPDSGAGPPAACRHPLSRRPEAGESGVESVHAHISASQQPRLLMQLPQRFVAELAIDMDG